MPREIQRPEMPTLQAHKAAHGQPVTSTRHSLARRNRLAGGVAEKRLHHALLSAEEVRV